MQYYHYGAWQQTAVYKWTQQHLNYLPLLQLTHLDNLYHSLSIVASLWHFYLMSSFTLAPAVRSHHRCGIP
jgi:hypothetical protein